jgi:hypothetical protein
VEGRDVKVGMRLQHEQAAEVTTAMQVMRQVAAAAAKWARCYGWSAVVCDVHVVG